MLSIPYLRPCDTGLYVVSIRFRCLEDHEHQGHGKYNTVPGDRRQMFNTEALLRGSDTIAVCEGEIDAVTAEACGIPTVGLPGAQTWRKIFREPFLGYESVFILADGDEAGDSMAGTIMRDLPNAKHIPMPDGHDVNSVVNTEGWGPKYLRERIV